MTASDLPAVLAIERVSFPEPWSEIMFRSELENTSSYSRIALLDRSEIPSGLAGYLCASTVLDEMDLRDIAVHPAARKLGIARTLVTDLLDEARRKGVRYVHLEVRRSNIAAQNLYRQHGFQEVGVRKAYYHHPSEDALLFTLDLGL